MRGDERTRGERDFSIGERSFLRSFLKGDLDLDLPARLDRSKRSLLESGPLLAHSIRIDPPRYDFPCKRWYASKASRESSYSTKA